MQVPFFLIVFYFTFTLMIAGLAKVDYPYEFARILRTTHLFPDMLIQPLTQIVSWGEVGLALWLVSSLAPVLAATTNLILFAGFLIFKISVARRNLLTDCGCFGETYHRKVDAVSIIVSAIQLGLAFLYLWLVAQTEPVNIAIRLIFLAGFTAFGFLLYMRIIQRRKLRPQTT